MTEYTPLGGEFLVNSSITGDQLFPAVTALAGGGYVVCWTDTSGVGGDSSGYAIKAQLIGSDGTPIGAEFLVNTNTLNNQLVAQVAALDTGGFAITWMDNSQAGADANGYGVVMRVYGADGRMLRISGPRPLFALKSRAAMVSIPTIYRGVPENTSVLI